MKQFILIIAFLFTVGTQLQAKEPIPLNHETTTYNIDAPDVAIVQNACITIAIGEEHNHQRQYVHHTTNSRHVASITSSGHSQGQYNYKQAIGSSYLGQIESSDTFYKKSWQRNSSRMYMRGVRAGSQIIQRNNCFAKTNYYRAKTNHCTNNKQTQFFAKGVFLHRNCLRANSDCTYCIKIYKTIVLPDNW